MKRENIIGYMEDPARLDQSSLQEVEELVEAYPWFQTAHLLMARNHHNLDSLRSRDMLKRASTYAGDRTVLYRLISSVRKQIVHDRLPEQDVRAKSPETARRSEPEGLPDTPGLTEKEDTVEPPISHSDGLAEKLSEALKQETDVVNTELEFPAYSPEEDIPVEPSPSIIDEYTFTGWFDHITDSSRSISSEADGEADPKSQQNLIDRFLEEQPDIVADPDAEADQTDRAESYTRLGDSLMTESLAKIYLEQGLRKKAILVYEQLSLKYPEKSTYFASQINRIKNELKEN